MYLIFCWMFRALPVNIWTYIIHLKNILKMFGNFAWKSVKGVCYSKTGTMHVYTAVGGRKMNSTDHKNVYNTVACLTVGSAYWPRYLPPTPPVHQSTTMLSTKRIRPFPKHFIQFILNSLWLPSLIIYYWKCQINPHTHCVLICIPEKWCGFISITIIAIAFTHTFMIAPGLLLFAY